MIRTLCIAALLMAAPARLAAQPAEDPCPDARTQAAMNQCAGQTLARADTLLNDTYQRVLRTIPPRRVEALRVAQRAWIRFRDAECAFAGAEYAGGSMEPMVRALCLARLTEERTEQLAALLAGGG